MRVLCAADYTGYCFQLWAQCSTGESGSIFRIGGDVSSNAADCRFAPRFDRKLATAVGLIGAAILTIMIGFSGSFEAILGMRLIQGLLLAAFPSLIIAYINEEFEPFNVGTVIGIYISGTTVGGLFGRLVVSAITDFVSWRMGLIVIGILYLAVGIAFFMLLPKPKYQRQRQSGGLQLIKTFHTALANKKLLWIYLVAF